jgi:hypothetical protein
MRKLLFVIGFLVLLAIASATATTARKVALKQQTTVVKQAVTTACNNVATHACSDADGPAQVDCVQKATKTVSKALDTIQKKQVEVTQTCGCTEQASHSCSQSYTATEDITQCQCDSVQVCNTDCLSKSTDYQKTVATQTKKVAKAVCDGNDNE